MENPVSKNKPITPPLLNGLNFDVLEALGDSFIVIDSTGKIVFWNTASEKLFGYPKAEAENSSLATLELLVPSAKDQHASAMQRLIQCIDQPEAPVKNKKGKIFTARLKTTEYTHNDGKYYLIIGQDISRYKNLENELRLNEERYRKLIDNNYDGILIQQPDGVITYVSASIESLAGYKPSQLVGKNALNYTHPDDVHRTHPLIEDVLSGRKKSVQIKHRIRKADGSYMWVMANISDQRATPGIDGIVSNVKDIDQEQKANTELQRSEEKFRKLFENSFLGIGSADMKSGHWQDCNQALLNMLGYGREEFLQLTYRDITPKSYHKSDEEVLQQLKTKGYYGPYQKEFIRKDKQLIRVIISGFTAIMPDGQAVGWNHILDISQIEKTNRALQAAEDRFKNYVENSSDIFVILDDEGRYKYVSPSIELLLGYQPNEIIGRNNLELMHSDDLEIVGQTFERALQNLGSNERSMFRALHKDGSWVWVEANGRFLKDENGKLVAYLIVRQKEPNRQSLEERLRKLSLVADKTTNAVLITDAREHIEWVNESFTKFSGYSLEEAKGKTPGELLHGPESRENYQNIIKTLLEKGKPFHAETVNYHKNGTKYWIETFVTPIFNSQGTLTNFIAIENNINERKEKEQALKRSLALTRQQNSRLENFTHIVSHNFRSHGANILGLVHELSNPANSSAVPELTQLLNQSAEHLMQALDNLNDILQVEENKDLPVENIPLQATLQKTLLVLERPLKEAKGELVNTLPENFSVRFYPAYLESILFNLISNAIRYRSKDRKLEIKIEGRENSNATELSVQDNGVGIDLAKHGDKIFGMYKTFHKHPESKGLGLYLIKNQINALGGDITVKSKPGKGARFTIVLPKT